MQRLCAMSKNDRVKLRATFGWVAEERERVQTTRPGARRGRAHDTAGRTYDTAGHTMRTRRAPVRFLQSWSRSSSTMSHVIPLRVFQTLKSGRWNCNVCGLCRKMTVLNYVRLLGGGPRKGGAQTTRPGIRRGRAHDVAASCARQIPAVVVPWFLNNVARNSLAIISNIEIGSLELQRLWAMSKNDRVKLRATFGWGTQERGAYRRRGRAHDTAGRTTLPGIRHCRAHDAGGHTTLPGIRCGRAACSPAGRIRSPSPRPRCPRPRPSRRTSRNPRRSRGSRPRWGSGPPGSRGSRRLRRAGTGPRTPGS